MRASELLCRLVIARELSPRDPSLRDEYFEGFSEEWRFLKDYYSNFGSLPNKATFCTQFPDFEFEDVAETAQWLADEVAQDYADRQVAAKLNEIDALRQSNPREAITLMQQAGRELVQYTSQGVKATGDLWDFDRVAAEANERREDASRKGITLGFDLLDAVCKGTHEGEIETYFARPGIGKSFVLLYGALAASQAGKKVAFISPEMNEFETGVRMHSYVLHVSALELLAGDMDDDEWTQYLERMARIKRGEPIMFYEPSVVGHAISTADVASIIRIERPDLVCIDGLMLINPVEAGRDYRTTVLNTVRELKELTVDTTTPIRLAHQANRESESKGPRSHNRGTIDDRIPSLHHMAESGSVEQFTNRAIALARYGNRLYLAVRKNRGGPSGRIISIEHDIDRGHFRSSLIVNGNTELDDLPTGPAEALQDPAAVF